MIYKVLDLINHLNMDDDLGLELGFGRSSSPPFRGRGRGRSRGFGDRTPRGGGFRGGFGRGESRGRGRGEGMRRGRGGDRMSRSDIFKSNYDFESPRGGYKEREYESPRDYQEYRSPQYAENGYSNRGSRGPSRGGGFPSSGGPRREMDRYGDRSYGGSYPESRDYQDYTNGRDFKYREEERYRDYKYRGGSPHYRDEFRGPPRRMSPPPRRMMSPPHRRMSPPRRRMSPPPRRRMSPPPQRFRSRSPIMMRRSMSPMGRGGGRFRGSSRGLRRPQSPPPMPPQRRERMRSPRYVDGPPSRKEFHDRDRFMGRGGGRGFRSRDFPPSKPGFRPKGPPYSGERY